MKNKYIFGLLGLLLFSSVIIADEPKSAPAPLPAAQESTPVPVPQTANKNHVVLDIIKINVAEPAKYRVFYLGAPSRLVIDLKNAKLADTFSKTNYLSDNIKNVRVAKHADQTLRIVLDLNQKLYFTEHKELGKDNSSLSLVIDLSQEKISSAPEARKPEIVKSEPVKPEVTKPEVTKSEEVAKPESPVAPVITPPTKPATSLPPTVATKPVENAPTTMQNSVGVSQLNALMKKNSNNTANKTVPVVKAFTDEQQKPEVDINK